MSRFDVVIVGAGPAGSLAAFSLASEGLRVALLDKESFPRDKPCGDGLTVRALDELGRIGLGNWVADSRFHRPSILRIGSPSGDLVEIHGAMLAQDHQDLACFIPRRELDQRLVDLAVERGAQLFEGHSAVAMAYDENGILVKATRGHRTAIFSAKIAVAADGAAGAFSRAAGLHQEKPAGTAIRTYYLGRDPCPDCIDVFYESYTLPHYCWIFPLGDGMCNLGLGMLTSRARRGTITGTLQRFLLENAWARSRLRGMQPLSRPRIACLRANTAMCRTVQDGLLAVGDAAGLVSPLTGAGISSALRSGYLAAFHIKEAFAAGDFTAKGLAGYTRSLKKEFGQRFARERLVCRLHASAGFLNRLTALAKTDRFARRTIVQILAETAPSTGLPSLLALARLLWTTSTAQGGAAPKGR